MSKYTPGPWHVETVPTACGICHKVGSFPPMRVGARTGSACIYVDYPSPGHPAAQELQANALLISAAPELLEALQSIVRSLSDQDDEGLIEHAEPTINARAAIAKALGTE